MILVKILPAFVAVACILFCSIGLTAQEMELPKPPAELARFDRLLGTYEGSGMASMEPGGELNLPWTGTVTYQKIMDGHFILDMTRIEVGPGMPAMVFRTYMGWDREKKQYVAYSVGNSGQFSSRTFTWEGDDLLIPTLIWEDGHQKVSREMVRCTKAGFDIDIAGSKGNGTMGMMVKGSFRRQKAASRPSQGNAGGTVAGLLDEGVSCMVPVAKKMGQLSRTLGAWKVSGWYMMMPGAPKQEFTGTETFTKVLGGHSVMAQVVGDPAPNGYVYKATAYFTWNTRTNRFETFHISNMGEAATSEAWFLTPDNMVSTSMATMGGQPMVMRMSFNLLKDGGMKSSADAFMGASPAMRTFEATYERLKK